MAVYKKHGKFYLLSILIVLVSTLNSWSQEELDSRLAGGELVEFYDTESIAYNLPVWAGEVPGKPEHYMVVQKTGEVFGLYPKDGGYENKLLLNVETHARGSDQNGAFWIAFHPNFMENRLLYFTYRSTIRANESVIEEYKVDETYLGGMEKTRDILFIEHRSRSTKHGMGTVFFGPDGYLYSAQGDHEMGSDDLSHLGGKILRIDINKKDPGLEYAIPADNPYYDSQESDVRKEIWASGFRVPWAPAFDSETGTLWIPDVGGSKHEEINLGKVGADYGSKKHEGMCNCEEFEDPLVEFQREDCRCITGGFVYRSNPQSAFYGKYLMACFESKKIMALEPKPEGGYKWTYVSETPRGIASFFEDSRGRVFAVHWHKKEGKILRLSHPELQGNDVTSIDDNQTQALRSEKQPKLLLHLPEAGFHAPSNSYSIDGASNKSNGIRFY